MDKLDREALDPKWFNEYYEGFDDDEEKELDEIGEKNRCNRNQKT